MAAPTTDETIEYQKLEIEREKVRLERFKAWWTGVSIIIPLVVAAVGISFSIWTQTRQARNESAIQAQQASAQAETQAENAKLQMELQTYQAKSQFEIKAAEIVMNMESPLGAQTKAKALAKMFPDRLPNNFAESFDPKIYSMPTKARTRDPRPNAQTRAGIKSAIQWLQMQMLRGTAPK